MKLITFVCAAFLCLPSLAQEKFPDGTPVSDWFKDSKIVDINTLGKKYILTDYGVINDSTLLQTDVYKRQLYILSEATQVFITSEQYKQTRIRKYWIN